MQNKRKIKAKINSPIFPSCHHVRDLRQTGPVAGCVPAMRVEAPDGYSCVKGTGNLLGLPWKVNGGSLLSLHVTSSSHLPVTSIHHMVRKFWNIRVPETAGLAQSCRRTARLGPESGAMPTACPLSRHEGDSPWRPFYLACRSRFSVAAIFHTGTQLASSISSGN